MENLKLLFPFNYNTDHSNTRKIDKYTQFGFKEGNNDLIDLSLGACGCFLLGFDRKDIIQHVTEQMLSNPFVGGEYMTTNQSVIDLTNKLYNLSGGYRSIFSLSGSDAVEGAIKLAQMYHTANGNARKYVLGIKDSYHGSTYLTSSIGQLSYMNSEPADVCIALPSDKIIDFIKNNNVSCLVIETCSWTKGLRQHTKQYWNEIRTVCREYDVVFILDDIAMCGGKTGKFFGFDADLEPDIFTVGKALTGGYFPLSATLVNNRVNDIIKHEFLGHGFTYTFSLSGIYSTLKYLEILEDEQHFVRYDSVVNTAVSLFTKMGLTFRNYGLMFDVDIESTSEQTFYNNGLNIGVWNNGNNNLMLVIPLTANVEYFTQLEERLLSALHGA
jgi:adenosylmethionine-8-amino-7-oxononanoate aminotransferase